MRRIINYAITLVLWIVAILLWAVWKIPYLCWLLLVMHFIELIVVGFKTGRQYGVNAGKSTLLCMLYGYTWWLPLRKQMKVETFKDADFIREG
jgi:hypothetical protein